MHKQELDQYTPWVNKNASGEGSISVFGGLPIGNGLLRPPGGFLRQMAHENRLLTERISNDFRSNWLRISPTCGQARRRVIAPAGQAHLCPERNVRKTPGAKLYWEDSFFIV